MSAPIANARVILNVPVWKDTRSLTNPIESDYRNVIMNEHMRQNSGYSGIGQKVIDEAEKLCYMIENDFEKFVEFVNSNPRSRYPVS